MITFLDKVLLIEDLEPDAIQMGISGKSNAKVSAPDGGKAGVKGDFNSLHPKYPAGTPKGGQFMPKGSKDQIQAIAKAKGISNEKAAAMVGGQTAPKATKEQIAAKYSIEELEGKLREYGKAHGKTDQQVASAIAKARTLKGKPTTTQQVMLKDKALKDWTKEFEKWDASGQKKQWVRTSDTGSDGYNLIDAYIRKGDYPVDGKRQPAIQLANIQTSADVRGQGLFSNIIKHIEKKHPDKAIVIEEVSENSIALAKKNGFVPDPRNDANWIKKAKRS